MYPLKKVVGFLSLFLLTAAMFVSPGNADAQYMKKWNWNRYNLHFKLPSRMRVTRNNRFELIAKMSGLVLKIKPWKSRFSTPRSAAMYGYRTYTIIRGKRILSRKFISGRRGFQRYLVVGTGYVRGQKVYFAVVGLVAARSINNFYVRMWWKTYNHRWVLRYIGKIARSFRSGYNAPPPIDNAPPPIDSPPPPSYISMKKWNWNRYNLRFKLPSRMRPSRNNRFEFIAKMPGLVLKIKPWKSRSSTARSAAYYGKNSYSIIRGKRILRQKYISGRRGFQRYLVIGTGYVGGQKAYFAVIGLASSRSINNFYARMWWKSRDHSWVLKYIGKIARSFKSSY